jgi:hypothetical protein
MYIQNPSVFSKIKNEKGLFKKKKKHTFSTYFGSVFGDSHRKKEEQKLKRLGLISGAN